MTDKNSKPSLEKLDVEDEDARFKRIQSTLEKLNAPSSTPTPEPFSLPTERSKPHSVPQSALLAQVQAFLPQLEASNATLQQQRESNPSSVDIESLTEGLEEYIEMNLGLGLFEQRGNASGSTSDDDLTSSDGSSDSPATDSGSDDSDD
ncbi:hypothetical protein H0H93_008010 [Arthromyces matolae]|nr:hypothetical protein H0H93_008010 [Arthromyces matolae]